MAGVIAERPPMPEYGVDTDRVCVMMADDTVEVVSVEAEPGG